MARIRTIKPEITSDAKLGAASIEARLLFVFGITAADDWGTLPGSPAWLRGAIFPFDVDRLDVDAVAGLVDELVNSGLWERYEIHDETYVRYTWWSRHQRIDNAGRPLYPRNLAEIRGDPPRTAANCGEICQGNGTGDHENPSETDPRRSAANRGDSPLGPTTPDPRPPTQDPGPTTPEGENTRGSENGATNGRRAKTTKRVCAHPEEFATFWDRWPKAKRLRVGDTRAAWTDALTHTTPDELLRAETDWLAHWADEPTPDRFIPRPYNWLDDGDWRTPPPTGNGSDARLARKRRVVEDFMSEEPDP